MFHFCFQFHLSYTDKERYENEERPEVQKQMLVDMAKKLPVYTRTGSGAYAKTPHTDDDDSNYSKDKYKK
ncbi:hypothetical protein P7K49_038679 [Saguinus oedipus]|uniref:Uncharacterized protein n=1 Tax=Saguinus oedipus TaxID=9490 RepID=A0ABQ9TFC4_SAGOE|nr:hypothetical protein P7K49_038679 [Saguinus oedipus]